MATAVTILGGLGLFLYGMKTMSESLQNANGEGLRNILWRVTNNRVKGLITGFAITGIIQSSSATTVMVVSFVNAGLINVIQATGIILGANIGTTVTGWIVALIGFKFKINALSLPAIFLGFAMTYIRNEKARHWGGVLLGFGILFLGMSFMTDGVKYLRDSATIMEFMTAYRVTGILSMIIVIAIGTCITFIIQSSSATMAMTMTLAVGGLIDFQTGCALILGENIGTTITAYIAAIGSSVNARRAARVHMLFNIFGVLWILLLFNSLFIPMIEFITPGDFRKPGSIADHMAMFHTMFNVTNALIFLPFIKFLTLVAEKMIPEKTDSKADGFHLKYISTSLLATPSMNINQASLEIKRMMGIVSQMYDMTMNVFERPGEKLGAIIEEISKKEDLTDLLEKEISTFLVRISEHSISEEQSRIISVYLHRVNELESVADHCESLMKLLRRKYDKRVTFTQKAEKQILEISKKVREFLDLIQTHISSSSTDIMPQAKLIENRINELRDEMRKEHIKRLNKGICDVPSGLLFIDMLTNFEKIGDHAFNIAEGISGMRVY